VQKLSKNLPPAEVKKKIYHYCAYQERCHLEVRNRLFDLGLGSAEADEIIAGLITEGYLNEERFARAFAGGRFRLKNWGRNKIIQAMETKGLTQNCIKAGLTEINDNDYLNTIESLMVKKANSVNEPNLFVKRERVSNYLIQKGFEPDLVWTIVKDKIQ
jgi:regulatory protein